MQKLNSSIALKFAFTVIFAPIISCFSWRNYNTRRDLPFVLPSQNHNSHTVAPNTNVLRKRNALLLNQQKHALTENEIGESSTKWNLSQPKINNLPRLYVGKYPPLPPKQIEDKRNLSQIQHGSKVELTPGQCHYITKVLRFKVNKRSKANDNKKFHDEYIRIFDGLNGEWLARVGPEEHDQIAHKPKSKKSQRKASGPHKDARLYAICLKRLRNQYPSPENSNEENINNPSIHKAPILFFAPITKTRSKILIEKCTELGAGMFHPIMTDRTDCSELSSNVRDESKSKSNYNSQASVLFQVGGSDEDNISSNKRTEMFLSKLQKVALEASEQSERLDVPPVQSLFIDTMEKIRKSENIPTYSSSGICDLQELLKYWIHSTTQSAQEQHQSTIADENCINNVLLVCRERGAIGSVNILEALNSDANQPCARSYAFLIGPEGGFSPGEEILLDQYAKKYPSFIQPVSLGNNKNMILRAETAAIMAVGAWALTYR